MLITRSVSKLLGIAIVISVVHEPAMAFSRNLLVVGDSITVGVGLKKTRNRWTNLLERKENISVRDFSLCAGRIWDDFFAGSIGASGQTRAYAYLSFQGFGTKATVIFLTNDWAVEAPLGEMQTQLDQMLSVVDSHPVLCILPTPRANETLPNGLGLYLDDYRDAIEAVCAAHGAAILDGASIGLTQRHFADGVHLNDRGHRKLYRAIRAFVPFLFP